MKHSEKTKPLFLSLGAGTNQLPLIHAAKREGFRIIAVDRNLKAPGFKEADILIQSSILRPGRICKSIEESLPMADIAAIGCRSYGAAHLSMAHIAKRLNLPSASIRSIKEFRNKRILKERAIRNRVLTPKSYPWKTPQDKERLLHATLPLIARPVHSHAKLGVTILDTKSKVESFLKEHPSDRNRYLVEPLIEGDEITVVGIVEGGKFYLYSISDKIIMKGEEEEHPLFVELAHLSPSKYENVLRDRIEKSLQKIAEITRYEQGPLVAEFIVKHKESQHKLYLVEVVPEVGGEYLAEIMIPVSYGIDPFQRLVRLYTKSPQAEDRRGILAKLKSLFSFKSSEPRAAVKVGAATKSVVIRFVPQKNGTLQKIEIHPDIYNHAGYLYSKVLKRERSTTSVRNGNKDRLIVFALEGTLSQREELLQESEKLAGACNVVYAPEQTKSVPATATKSARNKKASKRNKIKQPKQTDKTEKSTTSVHNGNKDRLSVFASEEPLLQREELLQESEKLADACNIADAPEQTKSVPAATKKSARNKKASKRNKIKQPKQTDKTERSDTTAKASKRSNVKQTKKERKG